MSDIPESDRWPEIDVSDPVQVWLRQCWFIAKQERDNERRIGGGPAYNIGAMIAGHKMAWLKHMIQNWKKEKGYG